jgi:uncharacterized damage-inducible protein DinB
MELLRDVETDEAAARPVAAAHSIWELVSHATAWSRFVERRLQGEDYKMTEAENFPAVADVSESAWEECRRTLVAVNEAVRERILGLDESQLGDIVDSEEGKKFTVYVLLHGLVQHNLYHAGQIALLKRALRGRTQSA